MDPLLQHEISAKLGLSNTKVLAAYNEAMEAVKNTEEYQELKELFED